MIKSYDEFLNEALNELYVKTKDEITEEIDLYSADGGSLNNKRVLSELKSYLKKLKVACEKYKTDTKTIKAGGFSGANSGSMSTIQSGIPIKIVFNDIHRGGYYQGSFPFLVQIQVGGNIDVNIKMAILDIAEELLSCYEYTGTIDGKEITSNKVSVDSGTAWSGVALLAPQRGDKYSVLKALEF